MQDEKDLLISELTDKIQELTSINNTREIKMQEMSKRIGDLQELLPTALILFNDILHKLDYEIDDHELLKAQMEASIFMLEKI